MEALWAVLGAVVGLILTALFLDWIQAQTVRLLGGLSPTVGQRASVKGKWYAYYEVLRDGRLTTDPGEALDESRVEVIEFKQIGSTVIGKSEKDRRRYFLRLKVRDEAILTGTWNDNSDNRYHYGACQLCYDFDGQHLTGIFVGRDHQNQVNFGPWIFSRDREGLQPAVDAWRGRFAAKST